MDEDITRIAEEVAEKVVSRLFLALGVDASDPGDIIKLQKDLHHLRGWRESMEIVKSRGLATAVGFLCTGTLGYILYLFTRH